MTKTNQTPQTQKEFIDYRFNETINSIEDVKTKIKDISDKLDTSFATKDYVDGQVKPLKEAIASLQDDRLWLIRLIVGIVVVAVIGLAIKR